MTELHPLLAHHVVNTLGWPSLRPLQKQALGPVARGDHTLILAPTAGGKTEAALFGVLTRMLEEDWEPLSVLYLCPLRALLNNLHPRVERYAELVGRRAGLWHGDVDESARRAIRDDPPDILLTTPESIEAMLMSTQTDHDWVFRHLRAVVVDEIHAFAGDDRGWHLLAVAERVQRLAGRELQRVGLSATVGNAEDLLGWLTRTSGGPRVVVEPPPSAETRAAEVTLDHVGSLSNAATVISRLHRGEKRLVFVDSRARAEGLAAALRERDVTTFVSHGSLGREERRAAEQAFAESRDCVIVATSTLELGIDVGDLDRVIQLDAPSSVASLLQRLGRTGRRPGTVSNALYLTTDDDAFLQAAGLLAAWEEGYVEPLLPPPLPIHLGVQQLLALVLQEGGVGRATWTDWLGTPFVLGTEVEETVREVTDELVARDYLFDDNGILGIGDVGRRVFGRQHFMDLMAVFSEDAMLTVFAGRREVGRVPSRLLVVTEQNAVKTLLLAGRHWDVLDVDWRRGTVAVEASEGRGRAQWFSDTRGLSWRLAQSIRSVLAGRAFTSVQLSRRATEWLARARGEHRWVGAGDDTVVVHDHTGRRTWWTFAGADANLWLAAALGDLTNASVPGDLSIRLAEGVSATDVRVALDDLDVEGLQLRAHIAEGAIERLKFAEALPERLAYQVVERRLRADTDVDAVAQEPVRDWSEVDER